LLCWRTFIVRLQLQTRSDARSHTKRVDEIMRIIEMETVLNYVITLSTAIL